MVVHLLINKIDCKMSGWAVLLHNLFHLVQFVGPSPLCSWGSKIINCYTIKKYTKYIQIPRLWLHVIARWVRIPDNFLPNHLWNQNAATRSGFQNSHVFFAQSLCDLMGDVQLQHLVDSFWPPRGYTYGAEDVPKKSCRKGRLSAKSPLQSCVKEKLVITCQCGSVGLLDMIWPLGCPWCQSEFLARSDQDLAVEISHKN